ncbi:ribosomal protein L7/L12 [Priestia flexa]|uniref:ribosomal protein L7/L12 n=1 Tax=Priestia flexa TaxID=86664 RepID=UPI003CFCE5DA
MGEFLVLPNKIEIQESEKAELDQAIEQTIALHKENGAMITKLTMDSVTALTASESRSNELAQQGFLKRTWNNLTGKNQKIRSQIDADMTRVQYASKQMIQKLAEQNLLTFDLVTAVNNKLNTLVLELDEEINNIYKVLGAFFKQTRSDIVQLEARLDKVERNVELLHWNATIEYQIYNGTEYSMLPTEEKIVCISNDFLHKTNGNWSTADLMLLKSTLAELGLPIKQSISTKSFYNYLIEKPSLIDRLFEGVSLDSLQTIEPYEAPLLKGIEKTLKINTEEKYILETVTEQLEIAGVAYNEREIKLSMIHQYLKNNAYMNPEVEVNLFDFVVELLVDLNMIDNSIAFNGEISLNEYEGNEEEMVLEEKGDYDVFLISTGESKMDAIQIIRGFLGIELNEAKDLIDKLPTNIISRTTYENAKKLVDSLESHGSVVKLKTYIENYHIIRASKGGYISLKKSNIFGSKWENYVELNGLVENNSTVAIIHDNEYNVKDESKNSSLLTSFLGTRSTVNGTVTNILVQHGQKIKANEPIMIIKVDE